MAENNSRLTRRNLSLSWRLALSYAHQISILENRYWEHFQKVWIALPCMIIVGRQVQISGTYLMSGKSLELSWGSL